MSKYVVPMNNRSVQTLLDGVAAEGAGSSLKPGALHRLFHAIISNTATVKLQGSLDGTNWVDLRTSTASEAYSTSEPWLYVRGNVSAYTSGTVTLLMGT